MTSARVSAQVSMGTGPPWAEGFPGQPVPAGCSADPAEESSSEVTQFGPAAAEEEDLESFLSSSAEAENQLQYRRLQMKPCSLRFRDERDELEVRAVPLKVRKYYREASKSLRSPWSLRPLSEEVLEVATKEK